MKTTLQDYIDEMNSEMAASAAPAATSERGSCIRTHQTAVSPRFTRTLHREHIQPLIDLVYSDSTVVQRDAVSLLGTLALNAANVDIMISSGSLKPLLAMASSKDLSVRRSALSGLANMTTREDIRGKLCDVPGGLRTVVEGLNCNDLPTRLATAESVANIAGSYRYRGRLAAPEVGGLAALVALLASPRTELKRCAMVSVQRLSTVNRSASAVTKEDPEGDGYATELVEHGVLAPLLALLKGGTPSASIDEDLRTLAIQTLHFLVDANDKIKKQLGENSTLARTIVEMLLLEEHLAGATQREACRVVQMIATRDSSLRAMIDTGLIVALSMLARSESIERKQFAATMILRVASELDCRHALLDAGGARTLCFLCRASLPRKVVKPAACAISLMSTDAQCVPPLLDAGAGSVLCTLSQSSDPEIRADSSRALPDMLEAPTALPAKAADQLLTQGILGVLLPNASSHDRHEQTQASRGLLYLAQCSPLHARILARKGAARALAALMNGRDKILHNAVTTVYLITRALLDEHKEPLTNKRLARVRGVLEVSVVGTSRELWARLNDEGGMPAAQLMRLARAQGQIGEMSRDVLRALKPGLLEMLDLDTPDASGYAPEAVAERSARHKCIAKIQRRYRDVVAMQRAAPGRAELLMAPTAASRSFALHKVAHSALAQARSASAHPSSARADSRADDLPPSSVNSEALRASLRTLQPRRANMKELTQGMVAVSATNALRAALTPRPPGFKPAALPQRPQSARACRPTGTLASAAAPMPSVTAVASAAAPAGAPVKALSAARQAQLRLEQQDLRLGSTQLANAAP